MGIATACVLWTCAGDPRNYHAAAAYRKAMGLNLKERSSGAYQGQLRISKRGSARTRQWLYFAALRLVQHSEVRPWYEAKKARNKDVARKAVVAVMRKLALALYHIGVKGEELPATAVIRADQAAQGSSEIEEVTGNQSRVRVVEHGLENAIGGGRLKDKRNCQ